MVDANEITKAQIDSSQDRSRFVPVHDLRRSGKHLDHAIRQQTVRGFHFRRVIRPFDIRDRNQIPITDKQSSSLVSQANSLVPTAPYCIAELIEPDHAAEDILAAGFQFEGDFFRSPASGEPEFFVRRFNFD